VQPAATDATRTPLGGPARGRLLRVPEVAARLGVDPSTVYRWIESGRLPALQLGGRGYTVRVDERELETWLYENDVA
jgi:excisionase family DNA binding protein